jgi:hypothetical protein
MTPRSTKSHNSRSQGRDRPLLGHNFEPAPVFDLGRPGLRRWLTATIASLTLGLASLTLWQAYQPKVIGLLLVDVSASAQGHPLMQQLCQLRNSQLRPGDWRSTIAFADRATVIDSDEHRGLAGMLSGCQLPDLAESRRHWEVGLDEGTSALRALNQAAIHLETLQANAIDYVPVVVLALHKAEPGPDFADYPADIAHAIGELTRAGAIVRIVGPTGSLADALKASLHQIPGVQICPPTESNVAACIERAFRQARQRA